MTDAPFAALLLDWHAVHGRHDLPWQRDRSAYRVWVSEVMLQQTQVGTVIGYFDRFMARFPTLVTLADAPQDDVLHLWSGLGYYARARNLQRAAQQVRDQHGGVFPTEFEAVAALPGIGRSTAAAILALSGDQRHAICDGNVKRVLARVHAVAGRPGERAFETQLWALAERETPHQQVASYTQAIMDLGATLCTRRNPACPRCPVASLCVAQAQGTAQQFPAPRKARVRPARQCVLVLLRRDDGCVWLQQRPARGIWGGLWSPPQFDSAAEADAQLPGATEAQALPPIDHVFTHFDLHIQPLLMAVPAAWQAPAEGQWYDPQQPARIGLPAPVAVLLERLATSRQAAAGPVV